MLTPSKNQISQLTLGLSTDEDKDCVISLFIMIRNKDELSKKRFINALKNNFKETIQDESFYFNLEYEISKFRKNMSIVSMRYNLGLLLEEEFNRLNIFLDEESKTLRKAN